jgi:hypothetical protein
LSSSPRGGDRALAAGRRGRRPGHTKLTDAQQQKIARLVAGKNGRWRGAGPIFV